MRRARMLQKHLPSLQTYVPHRHLRVLRASEPYILIANRRGSTEFRRNSSNPGGSVHSYIPQEVSLGLHCMLKAFDGPVAWSFGALTCHRISISIFVELILESWAVYPRVPRPKTSKQTRESLAINWRMTSIVKGIITCANWNQIGGSMPDAMLQHILSLLVGWDYLKSHPVYCWSIPRPDPTSIAPIMS